MAYILTTDRNENLQILRFFAAALVLVTHITFYIHERMMTSVEIWHNGEVGVPIFFVISGFVMQYTGDKFEKNISGASLFLRRRIARIFPLYWLITIAKIAIALVLPAVVLHNRPNLLSAMGSFFLVPMFSADGEVRPIHGVAWTLLHEMFFYYIFSLSIFLRKKPLIYGSLAISALCVYGLFTPQESAVMRVVTDQINLLFVAGMVLAWIYKKNFNIPKHFFVILLILSLWGIFSSDFLAFKRAYLHNFYIDAVALVYALMNLQFSQFPNLRAKLKALGDSSYSLYLIHPIATPGICIALFKLNLLSLAPLIIIATTITVTCAALVYRFIETPLNKKFSDVLAYALDGKNRPDPGT